MIIMLIPKQITLIVTNTAINPIPIIGLTRIITDAMAVIIPRINGAIHAEKPDFFNPIDNVIIAIASIKKPAPQKIHMKFIANVGRANINIPNARTTKFRAR